MGGGHHAGGRRRKGAEAVAVFFEKYGECGVVGMVGDGRQSVKMSEDSRTLVPVCRTTTE